MEGPAEETQLSHSAQVVEKISTPAPVRQWALAQAAAKRRAQTPETLTWGQPPVRAGHWCGGEGGSSPDGTRALPPGRHSREGHSPSPEACL